MPQDGGTGGAAKALPVWQGGTWLILHRDGTDNEVFDLTVEFRSACRFSVKACVRKGTWRYEGW